MLKDNPMMKKLVATGEERIGKLVQQLMSNETFVTGVQTIVTRALSAKGSVDKSIRTALSAMNLPSTGDLETLREKIDELEKVLGNLEGKIDTLVDQKKK
jgi:polyhydroxyalkanoate synthesis regulator phasin